MNRFTSSALYLLIAAAATLLSACTPRFYEDNGLALGLSMNNNSSSAAVLSATISADKPIYFSDVETGGYDDGSGGLVPVLGGLAVNANLGLNDSDDLAGSLGAWAASVTPTVAGASPSVGGTAYDAVTDAVVTVSASVTTSPGDAATSCTSLTPLSLVGCLTSGFTFLLSQISTSGSFQIRAYPTSTPSSTLDSNGLTAKRFIVRQISDTSSAAAATDWDVNQQFSIGGTVQYGDDYYFSARNSASVNKLFRSDLNGVEDFSNTRNNVNLDDVVDGSSDVVVWQNDLYFVAYNSNGVQKIFTYDGTTVTQLSNISGNQNTSDIPASLYATSSYLYFTATNTAGGSKLFSYDGAVINQVSNTRKNNALSDGIVTLATDSSGNILFQAINANGHTKLFRLAANQSAITELYDTVNNESASDGPQYVTIMSGNVYYQAANPNGRSKLYKNEQQLGNTSGNLNTADTPVPSTDDEVAFVTWNGWMYFSAYNSNAKQKLYRTDGTSIEQVTNTSGNQNTHDSINHLAVAGSYLYFTANNANGVGKLFRYDGTTVTQYSNTVANQSADDLIMSAASAGGKFYFVAGDAASDSKLFVATDDGVFQLTDLNAGDIDFEGDNYSPKLKAVGNIVFFFAATDPLTDVVKLFIACDTADSGCQ